MNKIHDDVMNSTTCDVLPDLGRNEELALFTYHILLHTYQIETLTVNTLTPCWTTSANTSGTRGIATCILLLWIYVGKIRLEIPLPFAMRTA